MTLLGRDYGAPTPAPTTGLKFHIGFWCLLFGVAALYQSTLLAWIAVICGAAQVWQLNKLTTWNETTHPMVLADWKQQFICLTCGNLARLVDQQLQVSDFPKSHPPPPGQRAIHFGPECG